MQSHFSSLALYVRSLSALCALTLATTFAWSVEVFPTRPIRIIVPFTAGGGTDLLARALADGMSADLGQPVIVENRAGGNTLIATEFVVRAPADGYTLLIQTNNLTVNPSLYKKLNFDTVRDLAPVSLVAGNPHVLVVPVTSRINTFADFMTQAKAKPGSINFASAGSGTVNHLAGEYLKLLSKIDIQHIPYKGSGSVMPDLLAGHVESMFSFLPSVLPMIKDGRLRAIAVTSPQRTGSLQNVPTIAESGFPGYEFSSWFGILTPAGTPTSVIERLNQSIVKGLKNPAIGKRLSDFEIYASSPENFAQFIKADMVKAKKIIVTSGAQID
jgi:tripartite-type tricarboxylate transporter receptor subunit TctC